MNTTKLKYIFKNIGLAYDIEEHLWEKVSFGDSLTENSLLHVLTSSSGLVENPVYDSWKGDSIPFLFNNVKHEDIITNINGIITLNYDVLTPIYYLLSGEQEINAPKDKYGRFQWKDSLQCKHNFTTLPVANYYMDIIITALSQALNITINTKQAKPIVHLTHDIDEVNSAWKQRVRLAFEDKKYFKAFSYFVTHPFSRFYPWKNLEEIVDIELALGYSPTFYFLPKTGFENEIKNADYSLKDSYINNTLNYLASKNINIGVHGSYRTHDNLPKFLKDKNTLSAVINKNINANRFHWLQFDAIETPSLLEQANITFDSSLGFQEHIGFRNSCCTPFYLYNHKTNQTSQVIEHPLTVMDCSLAYANYMGLTPANAKQEVLNLYYTIKKFNGELTLNFHNTFLTPYRNKEWFELYIKVIEELAD